MFPIVLNGYGFPLLANEHPMTFKVSRYLHCFCSGNDLRKAFSKTTNRFSGNEKSKHF